jgi:glucose/arabinose dehydrogenase
LAFPPSYANKQYFYVNYTNNAGDTVISRFRVTANPNIADPNSEQILLTIDQPAPNHNGGALRFSPRDGYLYIAMGDGGASSDTAQNPRSLLGKMLRVNVEPNLAQIQIPPDNPFVNNPAYRPEIWALGFRNPFRFSFDRLTGDLWVGDVGENDWEEIDYQPASSTGGENYGWDEMEGFECFQPGCNTQGLTLPVAVYDHSQGCAVIGGFVYRGQAFPALRGTYLYSDNCSGRIWGIRKIGSQFLNALLFPSGRQISAFGEGPGGELFAADHATGTIYLVVVVP